MITERLPFMARPHAGLELRAWAVLAVPQGLVAGAVVGVAVAALYASAVPPWGLALAVGLVTGAGPLANVSSLVWSRLSQGRDKIRMLVRLMGLLAAALGGIALAPATPLGLVALVATVVALRVIWCGIVTIRAVVWRANFDRFARTVFVARMQIAVAIVMAAVGAGAGVLLDADARAFRWIYLAAAVASVCGLAIFRRGRMRRQRQSLARELRGGNGLDLREIVGLLHTDRDYGRYLGCLFVLGSGTLMSTAPLILTLADQLALSRLAQVMITASIPLLMIPLTTPLWARLLARRHAIDYRVRNSLVFVAAAAVTLAGVTSGWTALLLLSAMLQGTAMAGGLLGWSLAHNDFAPAEHSAAYLGLHVTLAGVRGLLAPLLGVATYSGLEAWRPGLGPWSLGVPLVLVTAGAAGFALLKRTGTPALGS